MITKKEALASFFIAEKFVYLHKQKQRNTPFEANILSLSSVL